MFHACDSSFPFLVHCLILCFIILSPTSFHKAVWAVTCNCCAVVWFSITSLTLHLKSEIWNSFGPQGHLLCCVFFMRCIGWHTHHPMLTQLQPQSQMCCGRCLNTLHALVPQCPSRSDTWVADFNCRISSKCLLLKMSMVSQMHVITMLC